jgi:hypothetical protein
MAPANGLLQPAKSACRKRSMAPLTCQYRGDKIGESVMLFVQFYVSEYVYIYINIHKLHYITLHYITLHYITSPYITLHYITFHYFTLRYITLH